MTGGMTMKKIVIIEMGGTISAEGSDRLDLKDYVSGKVSGEQFLENIPELEQLADITFDSFAQVSSTKITVSHWIDLRERVTDYLNNKQYDGVVITHGTNTVEETAYFLHLTVPSDKPIVCVGAQRPFTALSSDAQINLINAVRVATSDNAYGKGVLVVLNDEINCAREATKTNTYRLESFQSGQLGFLGYVDTDKTVQFYQQPTRKHTTQSEFATLTFDSLKEVEITYSYAGATGNLIRHIIKSQNYQGIVVAGTGAGLASPDELAALQEATERGIYVVRSNRVGNGRVVPIKPYDHYNFISGDNLLPQKARILLMLALLKYDDTEQLQIIFDTY